MAEVLSPNYQSIQKTVDCIKAGGIVILPTNTNYSVVCNPFDTEAVRRIFQAKNRTKFGPLTLFLSSVTEITKYTLPTSGFSMELARSLWPGEVSFILYKKSIIPDAVTCGVDTIAVACHDQPILQGVIKALGQPVCLSSANLSGQGDILVNVDKAISDLSSKVDLIINDGATKASKNSSGYKSNSIVDFTFESPFLVRRGLVGEEILLKNIPKLITDIDHYKINLLKRLAKNSYL